MYPDMCMCVIKGRQGLKLLRFQCVTISLSKSAVVAKIIDLGFFRLQTLCALQISVTSSAVTLLLAVLNLHSGTQRSA